MLSKYQCIFRRVYRYFIHLAYKGTYYSGWQRQREGIRTIQQVIEDTISKMLGYKITIHGCGRTDTGVHSSNYYAHIDIQALLDYDPVFRLNQMLPKHIVIYDWIAVKPKANVQLDALSRTYEYRLHQKNNPFLEDISTCYIHDWDTEKMQAVVQLYKSTIDFKFFCKSPDQYQGKTTCRIDNVEIDFLDDHQAIFRIKANRFLQGQIRLMVGRLMDVAIDKMSMEDFMDYTNNGFPPYKHKSAPPQGLFLKEIEYNWVEISRKD